MLDLKAVLHLAYILYSSSVLDFCFNSPLTLIDHGT